MLGFILYFAYGIRFSKLADKETSDDAAARHAGAPQSGDGLLAGDRKSDAEAPAPPASGPTAYVRVADGGGEPDKKA
jgi:hypothetical protein